MNFSAKKLFLLDGLGALTTAILLSQILARFESFFGMPKNILYILSLVAVCFAAYSLTCFLFVKTNFSRYFRIIIVANISYCLATLGLVIIYFQPLTWFGIAYFLGEISIISLLIFREIRQVKQ